VRGRATTPPATSAPMVVALREVLGTPWRVASWLLISTAVAIVYSVLLLFSFISQVSLANWRFLSADLVGWSILLGLAMGLLTSVRLHATRRIVARQRLGSAGGGLAFVLSLLPSFFCSSAVLPSFQRCSPALVSQVLGCTLRPVACSTSSPGCVHGSGVVSRVALGP
jgi:hypothetical protein